MNWFWASAAIVSPPPAAVVAMVAAASSGSASAPVGRWPIAAAADQQGPPNPAAGLHRGDSFESSDSAEDSAAHDSFFRSLG